jgi:uncharacterized membrane protein
MSLYGLAVFAHVIGGTILVMTLVIMQLVVGPATARMADGEDKKQIVTAIQVKWHPVVDAAIIALTLTAIYFIVSQWQWIVVSHVLHIKMAFGIVTLACANMLHFYYRGKKRRLKAVGELEKLAKAGRLTQVMEKVVLVAGAVTYLLALFLNHSPF